MADFGKRELELMQILWHHGEQTAQEIRKKVKDNVADPTVRTMLRILEGKGVVKHRKIGRAFVYKTTVPMKKTIKKMLKDMIDGFFHGSGEELVESMKELGLMKAGARTKAKRSAKKK